MQMPRWLRSLTLAYPSTKPFPEEWRFFTVSVYAIATIVFVLLVVLNAALVGYETVTVLQPDFNISQSFWFDRFRPGRLGLSKPGTLCDPPTLDSGHTFTTNYSLFEWNLVTVIGRSGDRPSKNSLVYKGSTLQSCDVCSQYMDAHLQDQWADLTTLIYCDDIDGFRILAKTSFTVTLLSGQYSPPLLGAIPEHIKDGIGNPGSSSMSTTVNNMLQYAQDDMTPQWHELLHGSSPYPIIISLSTQFEPCPASNGTDAPCAKEAPSFQIGGFTTVFSDNTRSNESIPTSNPHNATADNNSNIARDEPHYSFRDLTDSPQDGSGHYNGPGVSSLAPPQMLAYPAIYNLLQTIHASVRIDLGNPSQNNFFLNSSMVNDALFRTINSTNSTNPTNSTLYFSITNQSEVEQRTATLTPEGPATIQILYQCRLQQAKPIGSAIISVLVATLSMFSTAWAIFMFISSEYAERIREKSKLAKEVIGYDQVPMLPYKSKENVAASMTEDSESMYGSTIHQ